MGVAGQGHIAEVVTGATVEAGPVTAQRRPPATMICPELSGQLIYG